MEDQKVLLTYALGTLAQQPPEVQTRVNECAAQLRATVEQFGVEGRMALALVGLEESAKD